MLYKTKRIIDSVIFVRKKRNCGARKFCSYSVSECSYYSVDNKNIHCCTKIDIVLDNRYKTDLYHLCSCVNREKSPYLYAPETTTQTTGN